MGGWKLKGFDTFEGESYDLQGEWETQQEAMIAAIRRLQELEETQPSAQSGGQGFGGIQDKVMLVPPDGGKPQMMLMHPVAQRLAMHLLETIDGLVEWKGDLVERPLDPWWERARSIAGARHG